MGEKHYYLSTIVDMLLGKALGPEYVPTDRLDWAGTSAVVKLIQRANATERVGVVKAMSDIVKSESVPPPVRAQVILIAANLGVVDIAPQVEELKKQAVSNEEPLKSAIINYEAFIELEHRVLSRGT